MLGNLLGIARPHCPYCAYRQKSREAPFIGETAGLETVRYAPHQVLRRGGRAFDQYGAELHRRACRNCDRALPEAFMRAPHVSAVACPCGPGLEGLLSTALQAFSDSLGQRTRYWDAIVPENAAASGLLLGDRPGEDKTALFDLRDRRGLDRNHRPFAIRHIRAEWSEQPGAQPVQLDDEDLTAIANAQHFVISMDPSTWPGVNTKVASLASTPPPETKATDPLEFVRALFRTLQSRSRLFRSTRLTVLLGNPLSWWRLVGEEGDATAADFAALSTKFLMHMHSNLDQLLRNQFADVRAFPVEASWGADAGLPVHHLLGIRATR